MKLTVRRHSFETNSSSHHTIILTNQKMVQEDIEIENKDNEYFLDYVDYSLIDTKEKKAYFLAGLFDYEIETMDWMIEEYNVFIQVLKDNKEEEILSNIAKHKKEFLAEPYCEAYCCNFFHNGPLIDCNCSFASRFKEYFKVSLLEDDFNFDKKLQEDENKKRKELYDKIYDFLYNDGIIVAYETL